MKNVEKIRYMWNGIKVDGKLYKLWYSFQTQSYQNDDNPHITMFATSYSNRFPTEIHDLFTVRNDTDSMTDYFDKDSITLDRTHPEWERVTAAYIKQQNHRAKMMGRRGDTYSLQVEATINAETEIFKTKYAAGTTGPCKIIGNETVNLSLNHSENEIAAFTS